MIAAVVAVFLSLLIWLVLLLARGWFWLCRERDDGTPPPPQSWAHST